MPRKRHKPEEIIAKLRQVDVLASQGQSVADAVRAIGVTEVTYSGIPRVGSVDTRNPAPRTIPRQLAGMSAG